MSDQEIMEVAQIIADAVKKKSLPEFGVGGVPMQVAEKVLGMNRTTILNLMEIGQLDIGIVTTAARKKGVRPYRNSYISPKKFYELTGYIWKGKETKK